MDGSFVLRLRGQPLLQLLLLSIPVGFLAALAALALRYAIEGISMLWTGSTSWTSPQANLPWLIVLLAPASAGLLNAWILKRWLHPNRTPGIPGLIEAIIVRGSRCDLRQTLGEATGGALTLGSGVGLGREGPTILLGASLASVLGERLGFDEIRLRILLGCGAAAGIAASFNTPLAGVAFTLEVILADYAIVTMAPIVLSAVTATVLTRLVVGDFPAFIVPEYHSFSAWEILGHLVVGAACGGTAVIMVRSLSLLRERAWRMIPNPYLRLGLAGLAVGAIGLFVPQSLSMGYEVVSDLLRETARPTVFGVELSIVGFCLLLVLAKLAMVLVAASSGFLAGLIGPSLFIGCSLGAMLGALIHGFFPTFTEGYGSYALIASSALAAATLHAPMSLILMVFEMTGDYHIVPPLMAACILASLISRMAGCDSVCTQALHAKGLETDWRSEQARLRACPIRRLQLDPIATVNAGLPLGQLKHRFVSEGRAFSPLVVVDENDRCIGIVRFESIEPWLFDPVLDDLAVAADVADGIVPQMSEDHSLLEALECFERHHVHFILIMDGDRPKGLLDRDKAFDAYWLIMHDREP